MNKNIVAPFELGDLLSLFQVPRTFKSCLLCFMSFQVRILYVRNLMLSTTEETLEQTFSQAAGKEGCIERVKKLKDYAFVHFRERADAIRALNAINGQSVHPSVETIMPPA